MGTHVISLRGAWRLGGVLLIISAITAYATALLLDVHTGLAIVAVSAVASIIGLSCLRVPWDRWDGRLLLAVPLIALVQVALDVALVDFVLTCLFVPVALYIALVFPSPRIALPFLALMMVTLLLPFVYSGEPTRDTALWVLVVGPASIFVAVVAGRLTSGLYSSREAYRRLSIVDGLTGVGNYRALMTRLQHETGRHARRSRELAPETGREEAALLCRRIERALRGIRSGDVHVSASIGTAVFPDDGSDPVELLDSADLDLRSRKAEPRTFSRFL